MMKNKHMAHALAMQSFRAFLTKLTYKAKLNGIQVRLVDRYYPSSKTCSQCGNIKKDLKLSDRIYVCECCRLSIDRDYNASLNIKNTINYQIIV